MKDFILEHIDEALKEQHTLVSQLEVLYQYSNNTDSIGETGHHQKSMFGDLFEGAYTVQDHLNKLRYLYVQEKKEKFAARIAAGVDPGRGN